MIQPGRYLHVKSNRHYVVENTSTFFTGTGNGRKKQQVVNYFDEQTGERYTRPVDEFTKKKYQFDGYPTSFRMLRSIGGHVSIESTITDDLSCRILKNDDGTIYITNTDVLAETLWWMGVVTKQMQIIDGVLGLMIVCTITGPAGNMSFDLDIGTQEIRKETLKRFSESMRAVVERSKGKPTLTHVGDKISFSGDVKTFLDEMEGVKTLTVDNAEYISQHFSLGMVPTANDALTELILNHWFFELKDKPAKAPVADFEFAQERELEIEVPAYEDASDENYALDL